jgi:ABC-type glutathione transport system ATPase component
MCDQLAVMYAGRVVESGPASQIFNSPAHPYTEALLNSIPRMDRQVEARGRLVGDQQARLARDADGADDALAHAARHLVRVLRHPGSRRRDAHCLQQVFRAAPGGRTRGPVVHPDRLTDLVTDREQGIWSPIVNRGLSEVIGS